MDVKMFPSGQQIANAVITTKNCYYKGAILRGAGVVTILAIYNSKTLAAVTSANMVAVLSVPAVDGECKIDNPTGVIPCPNGICAVLEGAGAVYHVRAAGSPK